MPAASKKQQRLMGWVHACQTGQTKKCPKRIKKIAKTISKKASKDFSKEVVKEHTETSFLSFKQFVKLFPL